MPHEIIQEAPGRLDWRSVGPVVVVDLAARLAAPVAVLALARSEANVALVSSAVVAVFAAFRAGLVGRAQEISVKELWQRLIAATRRHSVSALRIRPDQHGTPALIDAVAITASVRSAVITRVIADGLALAAVLMATLVLLGWSWLLLGAVAFGLGGAVVLVGQRYLRRADARAYEHYVHAAHDYEVLADAATELRAHGCEGRHAESLTGEVHRMALEQRRAASYSALVGLLPIGVVLFIASAPFGLELTALVGVVGGDVIDAGVLGGAGLFLGLGVARSVESWTRSAPQRHALASFVARASANERSGGSRDVDLGTARIELRDVSLVYPGSERATPGDVSLSWEPHESLAVTGANGTGKSTLALCILGLLQPTSGQIAVDGVPLAEVDWGRLRSNVVYVPQGAYFADDRSIAWHIELLTTGSVTRDQIETALDAVGLLTVLGKRQSDPLDIPVSQLSGGERKRLQLARTLLGDPELVVLDEPEAGLDETSRGWLRGFLAELGSSRRVLVIAHDPTVVPDHFARLALS